MLLFFKLLHSLYFHALSTVLRTIIDLLFKDIFKIFLISIYYFLNIFAALIFTHLYTLNFSSTI